jgi:hypothetical protein
MILARDLTTMVTHTPTTLGKLTKRRFDAVTFLGITNAGQHAYRCSENKGDTITYTKVFITPNGPATIEL